MRNLVLLVGLALAASGCREATAPTADPIAADPIGSLSFQYDGALTGSFEAVGSEPAPSPQPVTFASARRGAREDRILIGGFRARGDVQDVLILDLQGVAGTGRYPTRGMFSYGLLRQVPLSGGLFILTAGEVEITHWDAERVRGAFHGEASALVVPITSAEARHIRIYGGRFDVPRIHRTAHAEPFPA